MFSTLAKSVLAGAALSLALGAAAPKAAQAADKAPLVMVQDAAAEGGGKVMFAFIWPDNLKPQLEEKKMLLTVIGLVPFGSIIGPIALLGQGFDMEWALPSIIFSVIGVSLWWVPWLGWVFWTPVMLACNWIATQVMFANLNRPEIKVGE